MPVCWYGLEIILLYEFIFILSKSVVTGMQKKPLNELDMFCEQLHVSHFCLKNCAW